MTMQEVREKGKEVLGLKQEWLYDNYLEEGGNYADKTIGYCYRLEKILWCLYDFHNKRARRLARDERLLSILREKYERFSNLYDKYKKKKGTDKRRKFTQEQKFKILELNIKEYSTKTCEICKTTEANNWHVDHIKPHSKGGKTIIENGQILCKKCNLQKGGLK